jgi:DNA repair exonuclease SbcCD ATPase subunit
MPEQRMSLEEAGRLLGGLHPNTVRARAAKGKIRYEKDNSGKWFVFIDPEKAASSRAKRQELKAPKDELELPIEPPFVSDFKPLEATIQILAEELKVTRAERDELKAKLNERAEAVARLEVAEATLSAKSEAAAEEVERLRQRLEQETHESRKMLAEMLERMAALKLTPERRSWWPFRRRA